MPNPAEWRDDLLHRLDTRWNEWKVYDAYYQGDQILAYITERAREQYGSLFRDLRNNYMALVVDSAAERLRVQGFRFGDQDADKDAWRIWQANGLDGKANMVHTEAIKLGESYWMVQPNGDTPKITCEHPSQCIVATAPGDRETRLAALKRWGDGHDVYANVYLPDRVVKYKMARRPTIIDQMQDYRTAKWATIGASANPLGEVPIVPVPNNPTMLGGGRSDLAGGPLSLQDAINKEMADMLFGSEYTALRQRVILGIDQPRDPNTGRPIPIDVKETAQEASKSSLWLFPGKDGRAFEFSATDLSNFRGAIDGLTGDLAAQTRIPIYYFRPQAISNISAEALVGLDAGLVSKTDDKKDPAGEGHEEMMRLSFRSIDPNDKRGQDFSAETIWRNTESRSHAQVVDAAIKKQALGVPWEQIMEDIGYSPQQIDRMAAMRETENLLSSEPEVPPEDASQPPVVPAN